VPRPGLISVRTELVVETLVGSIAEAVASRMDEPLAAPVEAALRSAGDERARRLARSGYLARAVELERFEPARAPLLWLAARLQEALGDGAEWSAAAAGVAGALAREEPEGRPDPQDERAASWRVPGPGGHVRHYLALRAAGGEAPSDKRAWLTGFLVHCCAEAVAPKTGQSSDQAWPFV
jgi:hypothetical protein